MAKLDKVSKWLRDECDSEGFKIDIEREALRVPVISVLMGRFREQNVQFSEQEIETWLKTHKGSYANEVEKSARRYKGIDPVATLEQALGLLHEGLAAIQSVMDDPDASPDTRVSAGRQAAAITKELRGAARDLKIIRGEEDNCRFAQILIARLHQNIAAHPQVISLGDNERDMIMAIADGAAAQLEQQVTGVRLG